jgi:hypothetical protein
MRKASDMTITLRIGLCAGVSALALGGCGGGGDGNYSGGGGGGIVKLEDQIGTEFGTLFRAAANSDPADPSANAAGIPDPTKDPLPVP